MNDKEGRGRFRKSGLFPLYLVIVAMLMKTEVLVLDVGAGVVVEQVNAAQTKVRGIRGRGDALDHCGRKRAAYPFGRRVKVIRLQSELGKATNLIRRIGRAGVVCAILDMLIKQGNRHRTVKILVKVVHTLQVGHAGRS